MMKPDDPFYLTPLQNPSLGVHSLGNFMKNMAEAINLPGKHTNHSACRTIITTLRHKNISALDISQLSGHKNLKSIDSYSEASEEQQKQMSLLISEQSAGKEVLKPHNSSSSTTSSTATVSTASTSLSGAVFNNCRISSWPVVKVVDISLNGMMMKNEHFLNVNGLILHLCFRLSVQLN